MDVYTKKFNSCTGYMGAVQGLAVTAVGAATLDIPPVGIGMMVAGLNGVRNGLTSYFSGEPYKSTLTDMVHGLGYETWADEYCHGVATRAAEREGKDSTDFSIPAPEPLPGPKLPTMPQE